MTPGRRERPRVHPCYCSDRRRERVCGHKSRARERTRRGRGRLVLEHVERIHIAIGRASLEGACVRRAASPFPASGAGGAHAPVAHRGAACGRASACLGFLTISQGGGVDDVDESFLVTAGCDRSRAISASRSATCCFQEAQRAHVCIRRLAWREGYSDGRIQANRTCGP